MNEEEILDKLTKDGYSAKKLEMIKKILKYKREGISDNKISKMEDIPLCQASVSTYVRKAIQLGLITKDEIEYAKKQKEQEEKDNNPDRIRVLEGLKRGESDAEIAQYTIVQYPQIKNIRLKLIQEGLITQEEVETARKKAKEEKEKNKKNQIKKANIDEETIFHYLVLGYDTKAIKYKLGIELKEYKKIVDKFIKEERITEEEIKEARIKKGEEDKKKVYEYLNMRKTQREIAKEMDVSQKVVQTLLKKVKAEYQIDNKEIRAWKNQLPTSVENKKEAILEGLRQGMSVAEIAQTYSNQGLTEGNVIDWIKKLKAKGKITKEEILQARQNRRKYITNKEHLEDDAKILECLKKGYIAEKIAKIISRSTSYVYVRTRKMYKEGKITKEEIMQAQKDTRQKERQLKDEQKEREKKEQNIQMLKRLKREIDVEVRLGKKPSADKEEKIREYIDLCHEIYKKEKISMSELEFLERAMQRIEIKYEDIVQYSRRCIEIGEYAKPLTIIQKNKKFQVEQLSKKQKEKLQLLEQTLVNACRVNRAIQLIQRGNTDTKVISQTTGLSKDEANILKIQLMKKRVRLLSVMSRNKIVDKLVNFKDPEIIKQKYDITDFEMEDMVEQASCKRGNPDSKDIKDKVLQDSRIRIEMLLLKLGREPERIARTFNLEYEMFQMDVHAALEFGLIKPEELNGINPLSKR